MVQSRDDGGSPEQRTPPEEITDESPLIRDSHSARVKPISPGRVHNILHNLYREAGLLTDNNGRRYEIRAHSLRKYFRTQLAALGMNSDYIEYMMGHKISTYHDVQMKGIEFLRSIYAASGLSITSTTQLSKLEMIKTFARGIGLNPEEILTKEAMSEPHRAYASEHEREDREIRTLSLAVKDLIRKELLDDVSKSRPVSIHA